MTAIRITALKIAAVTGLLVAQPPAADGLQSIGRDLEDAIRAGQLSKATELAAKLDEGVQRQYNLSLIRDAGDRVDEVLNWLSPATETLLVMQAPVVIDPKLSSHPFEGNPAEFYALNRLRAINNGEIYKQLNGMTVRLTVAGANNITPRGIGMPAVMPDADVAYFHYFTQAVPPDALGRPFETANNHTLWRATAKIDAGEIPAPGAERPAREDHTWLALAKPDLLIATSRRETLLSLLARIDHPGAKLADRALPRTLPEWAHVNRKAPFWGLRHYSERGRAERARDKATGLTMQYDFDRQEVEIRYFTAQAEQPGDFGEFKAVRAPDGFWRFNASTRERGPFPLHMAATLLGFGDYR